jgi:hypothetical protein
MGGEYSANGGEEGRIYVIGWYAIRKDTTRRIEM